MKFREIEKCCLRMVGAKLVKRVHIISTNIQASPGKVTIPEHGGDINIDTAKSIMRQAGI